MPFFATFRFFLKFASESLKAYNIWEENDAGGVMDSRPVGFFDSGLGGASVLKVALSDLPNENYIYYGDDGNAPYGDRSAADIERLTLACMDRLSELGVKAIVIACNTATATCVGEVRQHLSVPVVSVEPAIKPACEMPGHGKVLMLATAATTRLERYRALVARMPEPERVVSVACPGLVERIERGLLKPGDFDDLLDSRLSFLHREQVDAIVLGCTHYIFIEAAISVYAKAHFTGACRMFDGNAATVRQLGRVLEVNGILNGAGSARVEYHTSGDPALLEPLFRSLISCEDRSF
jgi:glutamate racemase